MMKMQFVLGLKSELTPEKFQTFKNQVAKTQVEKKLMENSLEIKDEC